MKQNEMEIVFILDRSGSMAGLEKDTIGGFNSTLEKQKSENNEGRVTTVLFDNIIEELYCGMPINEVLPLTEKEYYVRGATALLDAVGITISKIKKEQKENGEKKTLFIIITDGYENASREYSLSSVKALIKEQKESGWEFVFFGANIDAVSVAGDMGIEKDMAVDYAPTRRGVKTAYKAMSMAIDEMRCERMRSGAWRKEADIEFKKTKK